MSVLKKFHFGELLSSPSKVNFSGTVFAWPRVNAVKWTILGTVPYRDGHLAIMR